MSPASYQTAPPRVVCPCLRGPRHLSAGRPSRAGNGTRTRDPNLGKVVLYQLSYSRRTAAVNSSGRPDRGQPSRRPPDHVPPLRSGGEGDRTPDLVNAIHALSQLSYAPATLRPVLGNGQIGKLAAGAKQVKQNRPLAATRPEVSLGSMEKKRDRTRAAAAPTERSVEDILASVPPTRPRRRKPRSETARSLGVYDADGDILDQYLHEVSLTPLLTPEQEIAIARLVQAGNDDAMQELVKRNLRFVISVAKKYQNRGLPLVDLIGEGNVGLLTAARKFDPDHGVKFISYAVWWIRQAILAAIARHGRSVRVPLNRTADLSRIVKVAEALRQELSREPTPEEIANATGLSLDIVQALAALNTADVRLDAPLDPEGDRSLVDRFVADEYADQEDQVFDQFLSEEIDAALRTLPARDARVLRLYFGLEGGREHTLEEIGTLFGVTRERVRQLRDRALKRLREGEARRALASFAA
jgi:RNA polymerase primary sigma factor